MAFAPPRRSAKASQTTAATSKTRIPLLSPSKKVTLAEATTSVEPNSKGPKVIASRYLRDAVRKPAQPLDRSVSSGRSLLGQASEPTKSQRPGALLVKPSISSVNAQLARTQPLQSPSRNVSLRERPNEDELRIVLRLRLSHTLVTCTEGETTLLELCRKAKLDLGERWHAAKIQAARIQQAKDYESLQIDAKELESLTSEDIFALETFIERVDHIRDNVAIFRHEIKVWSEAPSRAPKKAWNDTINTLLNSCDAAHLVARPILDRHHGSAGRGIVSRATENLSAILGMTREEVMLWQAFYQGVWRKKCQEIEERYAALSIPVQTVDYRPLWK